MNDVRTYELEYDRVDYARCRAVVEHNVDTNDATMILEGGEKYKSVVARAPDMPTVLDAWRFVGRWERVA